MKRFEAFYRGDAWIGGIIEITSKKPHPLFSFVATNKGDMPMGGNVRAEGRVEGICYKAELPGLALVDMHRPPPGHRMVLVSPGDRGASPLNRKWFSFAVKADAMDFIEAVAEARNDTLR